ncbi:hypothetical protein Tco_1118261 [Tanacetum coccineum]
MCLNESKILANIIQNHPLRFNIAASSSVPWIYLGQFWHTLKEDGSKYRLKFAQIQTIKSSKHFKAEMSSDSLGLDNLHYMTAFPEISRRARDKYHNLEDDEMIKLLLNSGRIRQEIGYEEDSELEVREVDKLTEHYRMTTSAPRSPNPDTDKGESSALRKFIVIRLRIPPRRSTRLTLPTPIPTTNEDNDLILQDTIHLSLAKQKSREELEAKQHEEKVKENLMAEEIEKLIEGAKNVEEHEVDSTTLRQNENQIDPGTRLEPRSDKESPEVKITIAEQPINVNEEEEESAEDDYELKIRENGSM